MGAECDALACACNAAALAVSLFTLHTLPMAAALRRCQAGAAHVAVRRQTQGAGCAAEHGVAGWLLVNFWLSLSKQSLHEKSWRWPHAALAAACPPRPPPRARRRCGTSGRSPSPWCLRSTTPAAAATLWACDTAPSIVTLHQLTDCGHGGQALGRPRLCCVCVGTLLATLCYCACKKAEDKGKAEGVRSRKSPGKQGRS